MPSLQFLIEIGRYADWSRLYFVRWQVGWPNGDDLAHRRVSSALESAGSIQADRGSKGAMMCLSELDLVVVEIALAVKADQDGLHIAAGEA